MKVIKLENLIINLEKDGDNVIVKYGDNSAVLFSQTSENISALLERNFHLVYNFFRSKITNYNFEEKNEIDDLAYLSLRIVVHYLYMYNSWRIQYKKSKAYENLDFKTKDFFNTSTNDMIISFYKKQLPDNWKLLCAKLLDLTADEFDVYYRQREHFYNK